MRPINPFCLLLENFRNFSVLVGIASPVLRVCYNREKRNKRRQIFRRAAWSQRTPVESPYTRSFTALPLRQCVSRASSGRLSGLLSDSNRISRRIDTVDIRALGATIDMKAQRRPDCGALPANQGDGTFKGLVNGAFATSCGRPSLPFGYIPDAWQKFYPVHWHRSSTARCAKEPFAFNGLLLRRDLRAQQRAA